MQGVKNDRHKTPTSSRALERRRQEALKRSEAGEPIAVMCREMGCAKSWLDTWKHRDQVSEPDGCKAHARRPGTTPTKTSDALEAHIAHVSRTLSPDSSGTRRANAMRDHLRQHGAESMPSRRTISRMLKRQAQEVNCPAFALSISGSLCHPGGGDMSTGIDRV